jgi:hypothetical protein
MESIVSCSLNASSAHTMWIQMHNFLDVIGAAVTYLRLCHEHNFFM